MCKITSEQYRIIFCIQNCISTYLQMLMEAGFSQTSHILSHCGSLKYDEQLIEWHVIWFTIHYVSKAHAPQHTILHVFL